MIKKDSDPVGWASLMYELEDAHEHLGKLIIAMNTDADYGDEEFRIDLGHVYAHLNRAWNRRNNPEKIPEDQWSVASRFPEDLEPVG
jgi:hypothetical protein